MFLTPTSLKQRTALYILAPVCLLLLLVEILGFRSIKNILIDQMTASATSHLQRTADFVDTRLRLPKMLLQRIGNAPSEEIHAYLLDILETLEGIVEVKQHPEVPDQINNKTEIFYSPLLDGDTISLFARKHNSAGSLLSQSEVIISFYDLIGHIPGAPWWTGLQTFVIDEQGNTLAPDEGMLIQPGSSSGVLSLSIKVKEQLLADMRTSQSGTVVSNDSAMPDTIFGFYRLSEADWSIVVSAQGETALQPIITFRRTYFFFSFLATGTILYLLNLLVTKRIIRTIRKLSGAATRLADGHFDEPLQLKSHDELGELVQSFNTMSSQLQQGVQLKKAMIIAGEVQRSLLPQSHFSTDCFEAIGISIPCDETGGDFFDILNIESDEPHLTIVVGDVVGHGIGAALLMATTRALLRSRVEMTNDLAVCLSDVNTLLCRDTEPSGNFVTVFLLAINKTGNTIRWVRAGHEPAMLYSLEKRKFSDLRGSGIAVGVDSTIQFSQNQLELPEGPHLILINTDGLTDVENEQGERFSKKRLQTFIAKHSSQSPENILKALRLEIGAFVGNQHQSDDITLVILKTR